MTVPSFSVIAEIFSVVTCQSAQSQGQIVAQCHLAYTRWPNKNRTFLRYHIFADTTDRIMRFLLKCSEITAENNKRKFFKQVLNILCKVTGNGLRHTRLLDDDQPAIG